MFDVVFARSSIAGDRLASLAIGSRSWTAADRLVRATEFGNGVPVWAGIAGLLVVGGSSSRRAAAVRAVGAEAVSSLIVNGVVKPLIDRQRPGRRWGRSHPKRTSSFPSSHAASGAAFATVVVLDWPAAGVPAAGLALLVGASRVYARQHFVSDVLGGLLIGATVGAVIHVVSAHRGGVRKTENSS